MSIMPKNVSAGLLLFRWRKGRLEVFLAHMGGPFWAKRDAGAWTIPKGLVEPGEELLAAACREFEEETGIRPAGPFLPLGSVRQKGGKQVHAWAWVGDADPSMIKSNLVRSGNKWFPEVDRCDWFDARTARVQVIAAQAEFIDRLESQLASGDVG